MFLPCVFLKTFLSSMKRALIAMSLLFLDLLHLARRITIQKIAALESPGNVSPGAEALRRLGVEPDPDQPQGART